MKKKINNKNKKISIVIPIFNEEKNIDILIKEILDVLIKNKINYEILCTNDGSTDNSGEILDKIAANNSKIKIIHFTKRFGQTAAMMAAIERTKGDIVVTIDADLQNDPKDIPFLLKKINEGYDLVSGWRKNRKDNFTKIFPSKIANWLISFLTNIKLKDYGCTLKAYRGEMLRSIKLYGEMHRFIPVLISAMSNKFYEIPVNHRLRKYGTSKYGLNRMPRVFLDIILMWFFVKAVDRPIQFYGKIGLLTLFISTLLGFYAIYNKIYQKSPFIETPLPILVPLFFISGLIFIMIGLIGEIQSRILFQSQNSKPYYIDRTVNT